MRTIVALVLVAGGACGKTSEPSGSAPDDAARAVKRPTPKADGVEHAEIKGSIRHAHAGGERIEEAGGHGELDPIHRFWGSSATDIYAAAWDDPGRGLLHSKGDGVWTHEPLSDRRLVGLWGSSARDIYVSGNAGFIYHGRGDGTWKAEPIRSEGATRMIWGSGPRDVYAASAYGKVFHSKGDGAWAIQSVGDKTLLLAIWGSGPNDIYVAGDEGKIFHSKGDGTWQPQGPLGDGQYKAQISGLWGASAKDVYAVSSGLFHSTGDGKWTKVPVEGLATASSVWGDGKGTLYVGASDGMLFVRRDGAWSHTVDKHAGTYQALWGIDDELYIGAERFLTWTTPK